MLTKKQAMRACEDGHGMMLYKETRRYGGIVEDKEWTTEEPARYAGSWRSMWINWHGIGWHFEMHNGEVVTFGHVDAPVFIGINGHPVTDERNARDIRIRDFRTE